MDRDGRRLGLRTTLGVMWTPAMTESWLTPGAANRPQDLPRSIAVPTERTRDLADGAIAAFLEHRERLRGDEEEARRQAVSSVLSTERGRERHHSAVLVTQGGVPWTATMTAALFDPQMPGRPTDLPHNIAVPADRASSLADDAVGLFLEYRDQHGEPEETARLFAVGEVMQGEAAREEIEWPETAHLFERQDEVRVAERHQGQIAEELELPW